MAMLSFAKQKGNFQSHAQTKRSR